MLMSINKKVNQVQNATISLGGRSIHPFTLALYYDKGMEGCFFIIYTIYMYMYFIFMYTVRKINIINRNIKSAFN